MTSSIISIFKHKVFLEIINEISLFSNFKIKHYEDISLCIDNAKKDKSIIIIFLNEKNKNYLSELKTKNLPLIIIKEYFIVMVDYKRLVSYSIIKSFISY